MANALVGIALLFILANLYYFFTNKQYKQSYFSTALFLKLFFVLLGVTIGFTLIYYALSFGDVILVHEGHSGEAIDPNFSDLMYFSGTTMLSVGYGDIVPVGAARFFSLIQASLGVLLPTAYFLKAMDNSQN
ncbi:potassium channel LctB [Pelagirhabdus alkalitolerans]|uniref:Potassium channel LctB n=1 Tax=Pelagirhabdus alkalitolerans TaxID=1612202 RepID=A0A1G6JQ27_9BACI|nr:potassium channel family protein [Pelagirhabdus alkalitolerans]SDC20829.1 potassium channel LctB [Pelagirhabdus alkalitolerans]